MLYKKQKTVKKNIQKKLYSFLHISQCRITFKIDDVFVVAIKEHEVFQQPQKCGGEKTHKGRSPTAFFVVRAAERRRSVYRLLSDGLSTTYN